MRGNKYRRFPICHHRQLNDFSFYRDRFPKLRPGALKIINFIGAGYNYAVIAIRLNIVFPDIAMVRISFKIRSKMSQRILLGDRDSKGAVLFCTGKTASRGRERFC